MSFREKSAWITLVSVIVCFGAYYGSVLTGAVKSHSMAALHLGLTVIASLTTPRDGKGPRDEREKMIQARSHTIGYYTLMIATAAIFIPTHLRGFTMVDVVNFAFGGIVIATLAVAIAQIIMFRRGY
jgi:hypothetical protein